MVLDKDLKKFRKWYLHHGTHQNPSEGFFKVHFPRPRLSSRESEALCLGPGGGHNCSGGKMGTLSMRCDDVPLHVLIMNTFQMGLLTSKTKLIHFSYCIFKLFIIVFCKGFFLYSDYKTLPAMCITDNSRLIAFLCILFNASFNFKYYFYLI